MPAFRRLMNKTAPLLLSVVWLFAAASCSGPGQEERASLQKKTTRPNIVLVVSDALRRDVIGCYGGVARTPNIDRLADRGVLFENAYSTSPWTPPSAVSIFTGNYATSYPYYDFEKTIKVHVPDEEILLAEALRERGYDTAIRNGNFQAGLHNCFQGFEILPDEVWVTKETMMSIEQITNVRVRDTSGYVNCLSVLSRLLSIPEEKNFFMVQWILDPHEPFTPARKFASSIVVDQSHLTKPAEEYTSRKNIE
ncbi:MAG: sulfatase-like hydrolase/transferase, partial [Candidatus Krumholzibacteria bacterium]